MPKIKIGDAEVDPTNGEAVSIAVGHVMKRLGDADTALATVQTQLADANAKVATLETEKVTLEKKLGDATLTPEKLRDAAAAYAQVVAKAKALGVKVGDSDGTDAIMKAVVNAKMGDAAKDWDDKQIAASFAVLAKDSGGTRPAPLNGQPQAIITDSRSFYQDAQAKRRAELSGAWNTPTKTEAA